MTEITKTRCDECGKEIEDDYAEVDWIRLSDFLLRISKGRLANGSSQCIYIRALDMHWCCFKCFVSWLANVMQREPS